MICDQRAASDVAFEFRPLIQMDDLQPAARSCMYILYLIGFRLAVVRPSGSYVESLHVAYVDTVR